MKKNCYIVTISLLCLMITSCIPKQPIESGYQIIRVKTPIDRPHPSLLIDDIGENKTPYIHEINQLIPEDYVVESGGSEKEALTFDAAQIPAEILPHDAVSGKSGTTKDSSGGGGNSIDNIVLNFDDAELYDVIISFSDLLKMNYIIETQVAGKVNLHTSGKLKRKDLQDVFYQILEINGLMAVKEGSLYKITNRGDISRALLPIQSSQDAGKKDPSSNFIIQIVSLKYISGQEMGKILTPFISSSGSIVSHDDSGTLLISDRSENIAKVLRLVKTFDVDLFADVSHRVVPLHYGDIKNIQKSLLPFIKAYGGKAADLTIMPLEELNSILLIGPSVSLMDRAENFITTLDVPTDNLEPQIYIYFLKNSRADDMYSLISGIFSDGSAQKDPSNIKTDERELKKSSNPFLAIDKKRSNAGSRKTEGGDFGSGTLKGKMKIIQDNIRNALIIEAIPSDYTKIKKILHKLDTLPRQVLISVVIAEIQLDDDLSLGVEWSWDVKNGLEQDFTSFWSAAVGGSGVSYSLGQADKWKAAISALAQLKKVNILSSPSILASDNKNAVINISTEIPIASAQIQYDNSTSGDKTQTDIQYRNTGVILNVTPHINEYGLVSMEINQEVSEQSGSVQVGGSSYPSFFKRTITTSLTVDDSQTIVIGGLIREIKSDSSNGTPGLNNIPILKWLFGTQSTGVSKSELVILITPQVIESRDEIDSVTKEFAEKAGFKLIQEKPIP